MNWSIRTLAATILILVAGSASASAQADPAVNQPKRQREIHVIGPSSSPAELRKQANDFVRRTGVANGSDPVARWIEPVCPKVVGIKPEYAQIVETRMREIAELSGIKLGKPDCQANIAVTFTTDSRGLMRQIYKKAPSRLTELSPAERERLLTDDAPIRWWYNSRSQGADGMRVANSDSLLVSADATDGRTFSAGTGGESAIGNGTQTVQAYRSSIIGTLAVRALFKATVVIDVNLAQGRSLDAVAAYAAMVAYAETTPTDQPIPNSILGLFDAGNVYSDPTDWDIALLRTLYSMPHDRAGWKQRRLLVGAIINPSERLDEEE